MLNNLKRDLYCAQKQLLMRKGIIDKKITTFDDSYYENKKPMELDGVTYDTYSKDLSKLLPSGKCYEKTLYMFFCFEEAILVIADDKELEYQYGKEYARHSWIEIGDYVYDTSLMKRFDRALYYEIYQPDNIQKYIKEQDKYSDCIAAIKLNTIVMKNSSRHFYWNSISTLLSQ